MIQARPWVRAREAEITWPEGAFIALTCLFEFLPLIWAMAIGQTSLIILVLLTGTLLAWKRNADTTAGVLLGLAVALKLTPALLTIFFWWRGRRRIAWVSAATFAVAQALAILVMGWDIHRRFFLEVVPMAAEEETEEASTWFRTRTSTPLPIFGSTP